MTYSFLNFNGAAIEFRNGQVISTHTLLSYPASFPLILSAHLTSPQLTP